MQRPVASISLFTCLFWGLLLSITFAAPQAVRLDLPPMVPAFPMANLDANRVYPNHRFFHIELPISTMVESTYRGELDELVVEISSHHPGIQIADYAPRTELAPSTQGPISVSQNYDRQRDAAIQGAAAYPGVGWARGHAAFQDNVTLQRTYLEAPPTQLVAASGTLDRRSGVYFKFRKSPQTSLEGEHTVHMLWEVPPGWRGDLLEVSCTAVGGAKSKTLQASRFLLAVYQAGDQVAADVAKGHGLYEQRLRWAAQQHAKQIQRVNRPTPIHSVGLALDVLDPVIPDSWLESILFGSTPQYPMGSTARLPVDVRVAILDYLDQKIAMQTLAGLLPQSAERNRLAQGNPPRLSQ